MKIWYFLCLMFCIYSLNTFVQESYQVAYTLLPDDHHEPIHRLDCRRLSDLSLNKTKYSMSLLKEDLVRHFENYKSYGWSKENIEFGKQFVLNRTKSGQFLIFNEMVCFIIRNEEEKDAMIWFLGDLSRLLFAFRKDPFDWAKMNYPNDRFIQIILLKKQRPYSNCVPGYCRFRCLNECYKSGFRLSKYYYEGNETGLIHLNQPMNRSVELHEKNCQSKCKRHDCKLVYLFLRSEPQPQPDSTIMYKSRRVLTQFDYWTQLIGLLSSFTSISFYPLLSSLSTFAIMRMVRRIKLRGPLILTSKLIMLLVSLLCCAYLYHRIIMDYNKKVDNPIKKQTFTNLPKPEIIRLAVCIPVSRIFASYSGPLGYPYYDKMTLLQLEKATDRSLDDSIYGVYFDEQSKLIPMKWMISDKVLFTNYGGLSRCFLLTIDPAYSKYQPMQPVSKLKIRFKSSSIFNVLYLLPDKHLNHQVTQLYFNILAELACRTLEKNITKRSKRKCVDYEAKYANCTNRLVCVERCVHREFIRRHRNITIGPGYHWLFVVDRDYFSELEWSRSFPVKSEKNYQDLLNDCKKQIPDEPPCMEAKFDKTIMKLDQFTAEMNLEYEVTASMEEEPSDYQLALDILNIHNIFFAITILRVLGGIREFIRARSKLDPSSCASKTTLFFIYLLCLAGFTWHLWYLVKLTINSELTYTQNLEIAEESQSPLEIMFCFQIDQRLIDEHHKLTGNYLQRLTGDLHALSVFRNVAYLNESNHWTEFDLSLVQTFFFTNKKCFKIRIEWSYDRDRFRFVNDTQILRVNFNRTFIDGKGLTYFMTRTNDRMRFSKKIDLDIRSTYPATRSITPLDGYSISQELFVIRHDFQFNPIKKPLSPLYETDPNDFGAHQDLLLHNEYDLRSLDMPVQEADFSNELQDDLFEQFYYQQIRNLVNSNTQSRPDHEKEFTINRHSIHNLKFESPVDFTFSLVYLKKVIVISDEDTYTKLTLAVLNVLFLWFDLGVFDLAFNAHCICSALFHWIKLISICEKLSKSKLFLYRSLHDHLNSSSGEVNSSQND